MPSHFRSKLIHLPWQLGWPVGGDCSRTLGLAVLGFISILPSAVGAQAVTYVDVGPERYRANVTSAGGGISLEVSGTEQPTETVTSRGLVIRTPNEFVVVETVGAPSVVFRGTSAPTGDIGERQTTVFRTTPDTIIVGTTRETHRRCDGQLWLLEPSWIDASGRWTSSTSTERPLSLSAELTAQSSSEAGVTGVFRRALGGPTGLTLRWRSSLELRRLVIDFTSAPRRLEVVGTGWQTTPDSASHVSVDLPTDRAVRCISIVFPEATDVIVVRRIAGLSQADLDPDGSEALSLLSEPRRWASALEHLGHLGAELSNRIGGSAFMERLGALDDTQAARVFAWVAERNSTFSMPLVGQLCERFPSRCASAVLAVGRTLSATRPNLVLDLIARYPGPDLIAIIVDRPDAETPRERCEWLTPTALAAVVGGDPSGAFIAPLLTLYATSQRTSDCPTSVEDLNTLRAASSAQVLNLLGLLASAEGAERLAEYFHAAIEPTTFEDRYRWMLAIRTMTTPSDAMNAFVVSQFYAEEWMLRAMAAQMRPGDPNTIRLLSDPVARVRIAALDALNQPQHFQAALADRAPSVRAFALEQSTADAEVAPLLQDRSALVRRAAIGWHTRHNRPISNIQQTLTNRDEWPEVLAAAIEHTAQLCLHDNQDQLEALVTRGLRDDAWPPDLEVGSQALLALHHLGSPAVAQLRRRSVVVEAWLGSASAGGPTCHP